MDDLLTAVMAAAIAFGVSLILLKLKLPFLPTDGGKTAITPDGRVVEVNVASRGKTTGVGILFTPVWYIVSLLFFGFSEEMLLNAALLFAMTLAGFLDDRSAKPWPDWVKGLLDLVISIGVTAVFLVHHDTEVGFFSLRFVIPPAVYAVMAVVMLWASVNVTNCSDGVDGLCGSVTIVELIAFGMLFDLPRAFGGMSCVLMGALAAYLACNWFPSTVLMGDGGSRPIGLFLGMLAMQSRHPFALLLLSFVFIFDGGIGLIKVFLKRRLKIVILEKVRFPFHDHLRKNKNWNVPNVAFFAIEAEAVCLIVARCLILLFGA